MEHVLNQYERQKRITNQILTLFLAGSTMVVCQFPASSFQYTKFFTVYRWTRQIVTLEFGPLSEKDRFILLLFFLSRPLSDRTKQIIRQRIDWSYKNEVAFAFLYKVFRESIMSSSTPVIASCHTFSQLPQSTLHELLHTHSSSSDDMLLPRPLSARTREESRQLLLNILDQALSLVDEMASDYFEDDGVSCRNAVLPQWRNTLTSIQASQVSQSTQC